MIDQASQLRDLMQRSFAHENEKESVALKPEPGRVSVRPPSSTHSYHRRANVSAEPVESFSPTRPLPKVARAVAVVSGKGGVGKSNLAVNTAIAMTRMGMKVCLFDADLALANADVLCNLTPKFTLAHVIAGKAQLVDSVMPAPGGFWLVPGASGIRSMANLGMRERQALITQLASIEQLVDVILLDCGAGINPTVLEFSTAAHAALVVMTPEPTSITDGYGMMKSMYAQSPNARIGVAINMARDDTEGIEVFQRVNRVARRFLNRNPKFSGVVPYDPAVPASVRARMPFALFAPDAAVTHAITRLASNILGRSDYDGCADATSEKKPGFFWRLAGRFGMINAGEARD